MLNMGASERQGRGGVESEGGRLETEPACLASLVPDSLDGPSPTPLLEAEPPTWEDEVVGEGCFLPAVLTLERQAWTGRGILAVPPPPTPTAQHRGLKVSRK